MLGAAAISPWAIQLLTDRPVLSFRVTAVSLALDLFLLAAVVGIVARGRVRRLPCISCSGPFRSR